MEKGDHGGQGHTLYTKTQHQSHLLLYTKLQSSTPSDINKRYQCISNEQVYSNFEIKKSNINTCTNEVQIKCSISPCN